MAAVKAHPQHWLEEDLAALAAAHPAVAKALKRVGPPEPRVRPGGFGTLAKIIVGQQVSTHAARAIGQRLTQSLGGGWVPGRCSPPPTKPFAGRACRGRRFATSAPWRSRWRPAPCPLRRLPRMEDAAVVEAITSVLGFGVWSAQMYLLFSLGRRDVWPAGDLAVRGGFARLQGWEARPTEGQVRDASGPFAPRRSALALLCWRVYSEAPL